MDIDAPRRWNAIITQITAMRREIAARNLHAVGRGLQ